MLMVLKSPPLFNRWVSCHLLLAMMSFNRHSPELVKLLPSAPVFCRESIMNYNSVRL